MNNFCKRWRKKGKFNFNLWENYYHSSIISQSNNLYKKKKEICQLKLVGRNVRFVNRVFVLLPICFVKRRMKRRISVFIPKEGEPRNGTLRKAGRAAPLLCDRRCPNVAKTGNETGDNSEILLEICCVQLYFWKVNPRSLLEILIKIWCTTRQSWALSISIPETTLDDTLLNYQT